jgi:galactokinase
VIDASSTGPSKLVEAVVRTFADRFHQPARWAAAAPGRVNLIGEHTDYNGGFVFPMAIDRHVVALAAPVDAPRPRLRVWSSNLEDEVWLPLPAGEPPAAFVASLRRAPIGQGSRWGHYLAGVLGELVALSDVPLRIPSLDVLLTSDVPLGAGLSSSAALEVAMATLLETVTGLALAPLAKAELCQRAERRWAGVPCGIMDQLASTVAEEGSALLIDCQALRWQAVPLPAEVGVLITSSQVRHALDDGAYARRASECAQAARILEVATLRDASRERLTACEGTMDPALFRRARHVITENDRTLAAARALQAGDLPEVGRLLFEGHRSLRDDFDVSCPELDALVEVAEEIGLDGGVLGARMTGGGFGGSTVTLVRRDAAEGVAAALARGFARRTGRRTTPFLSSPAAGAHACDLPERGRR